MGSYEEAERTVAEVGRVLSHDGVAYFGEVPTLDERQGATPRISLVGMAIAKLKRHGFRTILHLLLERRHQPTQIIAPDTILYWPQEAFVALLEKHGFRVFQIISHRTRLGQTTRLNYVAANNPPR